MDKHRLYVRGPTLFSRCPNSVSALGKSRTACLGDSDVLDFQSFRPTSTPSRLATGLRLQECDLQIRPKDLAMLGQLINIPTDTLIDMLYVIFAGEVSITASDVTEIEQIQRELQRRGPPNWSCGNVN